MDADDTTTVPPRTVRPLDATTWDAFEELCASSAGYPSGCWCNGFHEEGLTRDASCNRDRKRTRVLSGTAHAALVFEGDRCVGWCQYGPVSEIVHIKNRRRYDATRETPLPDWRIGCNYVRAGHRRRGVAATALRGALDLIAAAGGGRVEGYPEPAGTVPAGFLFHGALSTFEQAGFERDRMIGKHRWVVTRTVAPVR
ncbi:GNAT family N-acetyltransferase [Curtobacterium sp. 'Ferrero']|uniref:GNAT family N-acetyltransferase n=1 Tax=Curtobacterium sp. 'Ferrero' TaxID=2033654 RepID=UPI000BC63A27|nr:GNAT family N-acetyltransferase [Curtobacterium sp. 'Ferrero']PCN48670.1 GNAT family N-acetyltransferase [Curtobacterium sp. 'Ferrero']